MHTLPHIGLEHRGLCLFDLQEKRVVVRRQEESDGAHSAYATYADRLEYQVTKVKTVEQHADVFGQ
jgi:hypothetical protein